MACAALAACGGPTPPVEPIAPPTPHAISGTVSGAAGAGVTLALGGAASAATATDASGGYAFAGLEDGLYTLTPSMAGYAFAPPAADLAVGESAVAVQDFVATPAPHAISGTVSGAAGPGASLRLRGATSAVASADDAGAWAFTGLADGAYSVTPSLPGFRFAPPSIRVVVHGASVPGVDFTAVAWEGRLSGAVTGACPAGVSIWVGGALAAGRRTATTDAAGRWALTGVPPGSYAVTPWYPGWRFTPPSRQVTVTGAGAGGLDFAAAAAPPQVVWGRVTPTVPLSTTVPLAVHLSGAGSATALADPGGFYAFTGLADGTYALHAEGPCGSLADPPVRAVTLEGGGAGDQDFVIWLPGGVLLEAGPEEP